jgi:hypothetical protein
MNQQLAKIALMGTVLMTATASAAEIQPAAPARFVSTYRIDLQPVSIDTPHP